jgi:hypothetical protein
MNGVSKPWKPTLTQCTTSQQWHPAAGGWLYWKLVKPRSLSDREEMTQSSNAL